MSRELILCASAAAAAERLVDELADGAAAASDRCQGFHAFALQQAHPAPVLPRPVSAVFAHAAAARARLELAPGDCAAFAAVLSELHGSGASPADVEAAGRGSGVERVARQLAAAFAAHRDLLAAQGWLDPGAVASYAGQRIAAGEADFEFDEVRVEPRATWTQAELSMVTALGEAGVRVGVALPFDPRRPELFAPLEKAHQELHRVERVETSNLDPAEGAALELRERLQQLFDLSAEPIRRDASPVEANTLPTAEAEVRELARRVRDLLRSGCAPDRIAVAGSAEVLRAVGRSLRAAGVPAGPPPARSLAGTLPGRAALGLLELAEGGIEREPLCRVLSAGLLPLGGPPGLRRRGADLAELLRTAGSLDHASGSLLPPLRAHLDREGRGRPGRKLIEQLELARELDRAVAIIEALPLRGRVGAQAAALWSALRQLGTTQALLSGSVEPLVGAGAGEERADGLAAAAETALSLERLGKLLGELAALKEASWPSLTRGEFTGLLAAALEAEPGPVGRECPAGVVLCTPAALVGCHFDHVFLPGLVDGEAERDGDVLLPAALREAICRRLERPAALRPSGRAAQRKQERLGLYLACCSARLTLSGSAPRMDVGGSPIEPAALLRELARVAGRKEPELLERPLLPAGALCLTREEAIAAHWDDAAVAAAAPARVAWLAQQAGRERQRREAIVAKRADPASGALAVGAGAPQDLLPKIVAYLERKPLSPSVLELLAGCGFRALCDRVLELKPPEERGEELAANEGGTVRHRCLKAGFDALRREGLLPLQGGSRRRRELQTLLAGATAALDEYEREMPVGHPTVWAAERRTVERQLVRLYGRELADPGWEPTYFELEFQKAPGDALAEATAGGTAGAPQLTLWPRAVTAAGEPRREPLSIDLPGGPVLLGGKIDRVDRRPGALRVIDYKTGGIDSKQRQLADGLGETQLQLAIYALLVQQALAPGATVDAAYVSISQAELSRTVAEVCEKEGIDLDLLLATDPAARARCQAEGLPNLLVRIAELVARARAGDFPVTPGNCRYCDHVSACRVGPYYEELD